MRFLQWFRKETNETSGATAEKIAENFLKQNQYKIIERNFACKLGEIDIIATHENKLIFVEVKYRKTPNQGMRSAKNAVTKAKQKKIILTAKWYLKKKFPNANQLPPCRFDVVAIEGELENPTIELIPNAFLTN